jgi:hypothetical protein
LTVQGEVHWVNNTMYSCHTSCDLLNAGTYQSELEIVVGWLQDNPYDVVTILIVNSDLTTVENFVPAIQNSGLAEYLYTPKYVPQHKDQWPTLGEMILRNDRAVVFMDYNANQTAVPYILDEFTHMWETPFSPQDPSFPCTIQRPPGLNTTVARENYMYLANTTSTLPSTSVPFLAMAAMRRFSSRIPLLSIRLMESTLRLANLGIWPLIAQV